MCFESGNTDSYFPPAVSFAPFSNVTSGKKKKPPHKEVTGAANLTLQLFAGTEDQSGAAGLPQLVSVAFL